MEYGIHWFRRDLRVAGNEALKHNCLKNKGRVVGIFIFDKKFLGRDDFSANRFQFFLETMKSLKEELNSIGSDLLVLDVGPEEAFPKLLKKLEHKPNLITFSRDYEPFAVKRDKAMTELFKTHDIETQSFRDHLIVEPWELTKKDSDEGYQVYSPFSRRWRVVYSEGDMKNRISSQSLSEKYYKGPKKKVFSLEWKDQAAQVSLLNFVDKVKNYKTDRDIPSIEGTSRLSHFLKNGSVTTAQIAYTLGLDNFNGLSTGEDTFLNELIWREFYYHILYRKPSVEKKAFKPAYEDLKWDNNKKWFRSWCDGLTGFPIVDAGMRELKTTGFMHNRVRMIVASFLVKDLLVDWRLGEKHFMKELLDGDLAPNNGGWQWAASTGCDAQPYFRIFNPWSQSKKFDKEGVYIKKFIPELKDLDVKRLHSPILDHASYPSPIVDHAVQRNLALDLYKSLK